MKQLWFKSLPSTIDVAKQQLENGCEQGLIVVAQTQSAGRGQFERSFDDVPKAALLYSQVLYLDTVPEDFAYLVGASLQQFLATNYCLEVDIKRPNDLYSGGRKLAGILIEPQYLGHQLQGVIVSVGMNVHAIPNTQANAICLREIQPHNYDIQQLASQLQTWFVDAFTKKLTA